MQPQCLHQAQVVAPLAYPPHPSIWEAAGGLYLSRKGRLSAFPALHTSAAQKAVAWDPSEAAPPDSGTEMTVSDEI